MGKRYVVTFNPRKGVRREWEPSFSTKKGAEQKASRIRELYGSGSNPRIKRKK